METIKKNKKKLTVKDSVTTGIFSALLIVAIMAGGVFFAMNPAIFYLQPMGSAILAGPIYLLLLAKAPKKGVASIVGVIVGGFMFITGMYWGMALGYLVGGIVADLIAGTKQYKSKKINILAYSIFCLGGTGSMIGCFVDPVAWSEFMLSTGSGATQEYIDIVKSSMTPLVPLVAIGSTLVVAWVSGYIGTKLLKKQFEKAGITA